MAPGCRVSRASKSEQNLVDLARQELAHPAGEGDGGSGSTGGGGGGGGASGSVGSGGGGSRSANGPPLVPVV